VVNKGRFSFTKRFNGLCVRVQLEDCRLLRMYMSPVLVINWRHVSGQQIHSGVDLAACALFSPIRACSLTTFGGRLPGATLQNGCRCLFLAASRKAPCFQPTLCVLTDHRPGRQIVGYHSPPGSRAHNPAPCVKPCAHPVFVGELLPPSRPRRESHNALLLR
jgi:hypothetical protein